jgi:hypothetical protein
VDRWSGQVKEVRDPSGFTTGEAFASWIWPMHTGEAFGSTGRFLWFLSGIGLFVLYVSGLLRWLHRQGNVQDREINFTALRPLFYRLQTKVYQCGLMLFRLSIFLWHRTKYHAPYVIKSCSTLLQRLRSMLSQQKRLGKNDWE